MSILRTLGRPAGSLAARGLCSRYGAALVVAASLTLAGGTSFYLGRHAAQAIPRPSSADAGQATDCGSRAIAYIPETNQFYCLSYDPWG